MCCAIRAIFISRCHLIYPVVAKRLYGDCPAGVSLTDVHLDYQLSLLREIPDFHFRKSLLAQKRFEPSPVKARCAHGIQINGFNYGQYNRNYKRCKRVVGCTFASLRSVLGHKRKVWEVRQHKSVARTSQTRSQRSNALVRGGNPGRGARDAVLWRFSPHHAKPRRV